MPRSRALPRSLRRLPMVCVVLASCGWLAWACAAVLGSAITHALSEPANQRVSLSSAEPATSAATPLSGSSLLLDGAQVALAPFEFSGAMQIGGSPPVLSLGQDGEPASLEFRGRSVAMLVELGEVASQLQVVRDGSLSETVQLPAASSRKRFLWVELPPSELSEWWFPSFLAVFVLAAVRMRPWRSERGAVRWLLLHTALLQVLCWLCQPVGAYPDSSGYLRAAQKLAEFRVGYYAPGYALFLGPQLLCGDALAGVATLLQAALCTVAHGGSTGSCGVRSRSCRRRGVAGRGQLGVVCDDAAVHADRGSDGRRGDRCGPPCVAAATHGSVRHGVAAGVLAAASGALRVTPLPALLVLFAALHMQRPLRTAWKRIGVCCGTALAPVVLIMLVALTTGSGFALTTSLGGHLYNSVVTAKRLYDRDGEVSRAYADVVLGEYNSIGGQTSAMLRLRRDHGMEYEGAQAVMQQIALEALVRYPLQFIGLTLSQTWDQLFRSPHMPPFAQSSDAEPELRTPRCCLWLWMACCGAGLWTVASAMVVGGLLVVSRGVGDRAVSAAAGRALGSRRSGSRDAAVLGAGRGGRRSLFGARRPDAAGTRDRGAAAGVAAAEGLGPAHVAIACARQQRVKTAP